jgi:carbamate kinase
VASIINQTLVSAADPAFENPTKFIGEMYDEQRAKELAASAGGR